MTQQEGVLAQVWASGGRAFSLGDGGEVLEDDPDDPIRTAVRQMRGVFAQLERGLIRQRMARGKKAKAADVVLNYFSTKSLADLTNDRHGAIKVELTCLLQRAYAEADPEAAHEPEPVVANVLFREFLTS